MIQGITLKRVEEPSPIVSFYVSDFNYYLFSQAIGSGVLSCHSAPLPHARKSLAILLIGVPAINHLKSGTDEPLRLVRPDQQDRGTGFQVVLNHDIPPGK